MATIRIFNLSPHLDVSPYWFLVSCVSCLSPLSLVPGSTLGFLRRRRITNSGLSELFLPFPSRAVGTWLCSRIRNLYLAVLPCAGKRPYVMKVPVWLKSKMQVHPFFWVFGTHEFNLEWVPNLLSGSNFPVTSGRLSEAQEGHMLPLQTSGHLPQMTERHFWLAFQKSHWLFRKNCLSDTENSSRHDQKALPFMSGGRGGP